jgi:hypothetical protein
VDVLFDVFLRIKLRDKFLSSQGFAAVEQKCPCGKGANADPLIPGRAAA